jgi:hypothetical protein
MEMAGITYRYLIIILILMTGCASPNSSPGMITGSPTTTSVDTPEEGEIEILVYFTSTARYAQGIQPFETPVIRHVPAGSFLPQAVLEQFFKGPTQDEQELELEAITSGFTGLRSLVISNGYAHIYLEGACQSLGATYTIAQPILRNLAQFPEIQYVKIYDENGSTGDPQGAGHSIPLCLEP